MVVPSDRNRGEFHRVVLRPDSCRRQQESQNLRVGLGGPSSHKIEQQEHQQAPEQAVEQVKGGCTEAHGEEKELSLGPEDCQWSG
jgi:hypothetical protein